MFSRIKILIAVILGLFLSTPVYAAVGTITQTLTTVCVQNTDACYRVLTYTLTFGTGGDETSALSLATTSDITARLKGWTLLLGSTYNGSTAPTDLFDITLKEGGVDILGTGGMNRPGTASVSSQFRPMIDTTYLSPGPRPIVNTLTLAASNNAVESGNVTIKFFFFFAK